MANTDTMIRKLTVFLKIRNFKDDLIEYQFLCCNKNYQQFDEKIKQLFFNTYKYFNHNNNKFILPLRKIVYPHYYLDDWKKFNEASLLEKRVYLQSRKYGRYYLCSYAHTKRFYKDFEMENLE